MEINFVILNIGVVTGISSFLILVFKFISQRYSFINYIKYEPDTLLLVALCKAEVEGYKFIKIGKDIVLTGHTQNNKWIKPYRCIVDIFSVTNFLNEDEIYTYKIDLFLLFMIKFLRKIKNKNILSIVDKIQKFDKDNCMRDKYYQFKFFKNTKEIYGRI